MNGVNDFLAAVLCLAIASLIGWSFFVIVIRWPTVVDDWTGTFVLRYSPPARVLAALLGFIGPAALVAVVLAVPPPPQDLLATEFGLLAFKLLGWVLVRETFGRQVAVSADGLVSRSAWRRSRSLPWEEVTQVRHECPASWFVFANGTGREIVVPVYMAGLDALVVAMRANLSPHVYAEAKPGFALLSQRSDRS
jgi:hypothetical protein